MSSNSQYDQLDLEKDIGYNPISNFKYNFKFSGNSFTNPLSSMFYMTSSRIGFIEDSLDNGLIDGNTISYDFSESNYLPPLPNLVFSRPDYKNTDILITKNTEFKDGYIGRHDVVNKEGSVNKNIFYNLGLTTPELVKEHIGSKSRSELTKPSYKLNNSDEYLYKFTEEYNRPYMPMFFGYRENGYESITLDASSINSSVDINLIEKGFYYFYNPIDYIDSVSSEVNGSVGKMYLDTGSYYNGSNIHYVLSLITAKSYKRQSILLADRPRGTIDSKIENFELNDMVDYIDNSHGSGEYVINGYNKYGNTDSRDNNLAFLNNFKTPDKKLNPVVPFMLSLNNDLEFANHLMMDIGPSIDVREYLMVRDSFGSAYKEVEFRLLGDSYVSHHGRLDVKTLKDSSVLFANKFFDNTEVSFNKSFDNQDITELEYFVDKGTKDPFEISKEDADMLPIATDKLISKFRGMYAYSSFKGATSTTLPVYPYTALPIFTEEGFYKEKKYRNYRYEGSFFNPIPYFSSPVNGLGDFAVVYNPTFRAGMGISVMAETIGDSLTPGYEGKGFLNTYSNNYSGMGNGANYLIQRLKMRTGIALTIRPSLDKLSLFKEVINKASSLGISASSGSVLDPVDVQNYIITNEYSYSSGYHVDFLYLPTERFNSTFINYDSEIGFKENDGVKIGITTVPTVLKCLTILDNDSIYTSKHRASLKNVRSLRTYVTTNSTNDGYVNNSSAIINSFSDDGNGNITVEKIRGEYRNLLFRTPTNEKLDNIVVSWYTGRNRVFLDNVTMNDAFKNSRYEEITGTMLLESSLLFHNELMNDFTSSLEDMESKRSSNPIVRECINLYNYKRICTSENGHTKKTSKLLAKFGNSSESTLSVRSNSSVYNKVSPDLNLVGSVLSKYN